MQNFRSKTKVPPFVKAEAGLLLSSRSTWAVQVIGGQHGVQREILSPNNE